MVSNVRLNLDNFQQPKSQQIQKQFSSQEIFDSFKTTSLNSLEYFKASIFDMVSMESLNLDSYKNQVSTVEKLLTVKKFWRVNKFLTVKKFLADLKPKSQHT